MFDGLIDYERRRWSEKLRDARVNLGHAAKMYEREPSLQRRAELNAARKLVEQTEAQLEEWRS